MSSGFEGAKGSAQFYWRQEDGEANCGVFHEPRQGHAYSICRAPRYVSEDQWMQDGGFIADAFNVHTETGLTPRQLAEQRAELLEALIRARAELDGCTPIASYKDSALEQANIAIANATQQRNATGGEG